MPKSIIWFNDRQRLLELLLLIFVLVDAILIGFSNTATQNPLLKKNPQSFFVLLGLTLISCSLALSPRHALVESSVFAALCYLSLFVARLTSENKPLILKQLNYALWAKRSALHAFILHRLHHSYCI